MIVLESGWRALRWRTTGSSEVLDIIANKLRIDTLCHEGLVSQKFMRFSRLTSGQQNMSQTAQNKDQFGLN
jgi:hypothetical protein